MRLVDRLLACDETTGSAEALLTPGHPLLKRTGELEPVALLELLAQSYAAIKGYRDGLSGRPVRKGFLVGVHRLEFFAPARQGDRLVIRLRETGIVGSFFLAEGEVLRGETILAEGALRLWCPE